MRWRLILDGAGCASVNMAVDESVLLACARGQSAPTVRFYRWRPPAVSVGVFQEVASEIDLEACRRLGIDLVRRPTGGGAVLHLHEVTYAVVARQDLLCGGVLEVYRRLAGGLLDGIRRLGVEAHMEPEGRGVAGHEGTRVCGSCFHAASPYEILVEGRKLVGSAQVRKQGAVLQHGSVLLRVEPVMLSSVMRQAAGLTETGRVEWARASVIGLEEASGRTLATEEVVDALCQGLAGALGVEFAPGELTRRELELAELLAAQKYGCDAWNLGAQETTAAESLWRNGGGDAV